MKTILAIDDEPMMLHCLQTTLEKEGYRLHITSDPDEGISLLQKEDIDLIMLDVKMPEKNGFELYAEIRKFSQTPVLFVTAYPKALTPSSPIFKEIWEKGFSDGVTDIIYKPFTIDALQEKVSQLIGLPDGPTPEKQ